MSDIASLPPARAKAFARKAPARDKSFWRVMSPARKSTTRMSWPVLLYAAVFAAAGAGVLAGRSTSIDAVGFEDRLVLLLRFMAGMKALMLLGALALTHWRLTAPAAPGIALGYVASLAIMAFAPGLIWSLGHIALGAVLFHIGLFGFLLLAWRDDAVTRVIEGRRTAKARR